MPLPALLSAIALMASPASADSPYEAEVYVRDKTTETVFLAPPGMTDAGTLPVFRICFGNAYPNTSGYPAPETLSVHTGPRTQLLSRGQCRFFAGDQIDLANWKGEGTILATVTLLR